MNDKNKVENFVDVASDIAHENGIPIIVLADSGTGCASHICSEISTDALIELSNQIDALLLRRGIMKASSVN